MVGIIITKERIISLISITTLILLCGLYFISFYKAEELFTKYEIKNNDKERRIFIESFGIPIKEGFKKESYKVPFEFNDILMQFEELQNKIGLSLYKFKGETLKKYTYPLKDKEGFVELYIYNDKYVAAAVIINPDIKNGFIKAFYE